MTSVRTLRFKVESSHAVAPARNRASAVDVIHSALSEAARHAVQEMKPAGYEYQSDFARLYFGQGKDAGIAEGRTKGQLEMLLMLLSQRFGELADTVRIRLAAVDAKHLNIMAGRVLTASSLDDVLGESL